MISHVLHIPFPEQLSDEVWAVKWMQTKFLIDKGFLGKTVDSNG